MEDFLVNHGKLTLALTATSISFLVLLHYTYTVLYGQVKPHLYTHFIWGLEAAIAAAAQFVSGAGPGACLTVAIALFCFIRAGLAIPYGEKNITSGDKYALIACLFGLVLWVLIQDPLYAVIVVSLVDGLAFYPTFRKSFMKPFEENMTTFVVLNIPLMMGVIAIENYNLTTLLFPCTILILNFIFVLFLIVRRFQIHGRIFPYERSRKTRPAKAVIKL